jgi:hypothetical protein
MLSCSGLPIFRVTIIVKRRTPALSPLEVRQSRFIAVDRSLRRTLWNQLRKTVAVR